MEFVSPDHTPKNLLLRAVRRDDELMKETAVSEYSQLKQYWQVEPYLAQLLISDIGNG